jgi:hypothetical protein
VDQATETAGPGGPWIKQQKPQVRAGRGSEIPNVDAGGYDVTDFDQSPIKDQQPQVPACRGSKIPGSPNTVHLGTKLKKIGVIPRVSSRAGAGKSEGPCVSPSSAATVRGYLLEDFIEAWQEQSEIPNVYAGGYDVADFDQSETEGPGVPWIKNQQPKVPACRGSEIKTQKSPLVLMFNHKSQTKGPGVPWIKNPATGLFPGMCSTVGGPPPSTCVSPRWPEDALPSSRKSVSPGTSGTARSAQTPISRLLWRAGRAEQSKIGNLKPTAKRPRSGASKI